jgi:8-oxo-dGTP pyrophosphatase MutT (NUDIX family)
MATRPPLVDAAVLVPVYRDAEGDVRVILVRRTDGGAHGGQIAFPGGKREPSDDSLVHTALREAHEEIGLNPVAAEVLVQLPEVITITTGFRIVSYLARITPRQKWKLEAREVAEVFDVKVSDLARPEARGESIERFPEWPNPLRIEFFHLGEHRLWGATYRILEPIIPRLLRGDWDI